jgi:hypothetical protein
MSGPRLNAAYYAAPVAEFLRAAESEAYAPLAAPKGYTLAPEQLSAWRLQLPVLRDTLSEKGAGSALAVPVPFFARGAKWTDVKKIERRQYLKNASLVLLTRGEAGDGDLRPAGGETRQDAEPGVLSRRERVPHRLGSAAGLGRFGFNRAWQLAEQHPLKVDLVPGVVDIDPDNSALGVIVDDNAFRDFPAVYARPLGKLDVQRVGVGVVVEFHGRNPRSGNALWTVILSSSVTTRRYRPPSSGIWAQNLQRLFS